MKVFLSPSDQTKNLYAYGNTNESVVCKEIAELCKEALIRSGVEVMLMHNCSMSSASSKANEWGADLYIPIHTNAFNGKVGGTRMFYYVGSTNGKKACEAIYKYLAPLTPGTSESITSRKDLYELRVPNAPTAYVEADFHDNPEIAKWIIEHKLEIAEAIAQGACDYLGVKYKASSKPTANTDTLYKVQVGAYAIKANATKMLDALKAAGFEGFIVTEKK